MRRLRLKRHEPKGVVGGTRFDLVIYCLADLLEETASLGVVAGITRGDPLHTFADAGIDFDTEVPDLGVGGVGGGEGKRGRENARGKGGRERGREGGREGGRGE